MTTASRFHLLRVGRQVTTPDYTFLLRRNRPLPSAGRAAAPRFAPRLCRRRREYLAPLPSTLPPKLFFSTPSATNLPIHPSPSCSTSQGPCVFPTRSYRQQLPMLSPCPNMCHVPAFRPTPRPAQAQDLAHRVLPSCARLRTASPYPRRCSRTAPLFPVDARAPPHRRTAAPPHRCTAAPPRRRTAAPPHHRRTAAPPRRRNAAPPHRRSAAAPQPAAGTHLLDGRHGGRRRARAQRNTTEPRKQPARRENCWRPRFSSSNAAAPRSQGAALRYLSTVAQRQALARRGLRKAAQAGPARRRRRRRKRRKRQQKPASGRGAPAQAGTRGKRCSWK